MTWVITVTNIICHCFNIEHSHPVKKKTNKTKPKQTPQNKTKPKQTNQPLLK